MYNDAEWLKSFAKDKLKADVFDIPFATSIIVPRPLTIEQLDDIVRELKRTYSSKMSLLERQLAETEHKLAEAVHELDRIKKTT